MIVYGLDRPLSGISRYTFELVRSLVALGTSPELVLLRAGGLGSLVNKNAFRCVPLPGCRLWPGLLTLGNVIIPPIARSLKLDLVHDPSGATPFFFRAGRTRTVATIHDVFPRSCPGTSTLLDTLLHRYWLPKVVPHVDAVITVSQVSKADIVDYLRLPAEKVFVVYEGVHTGYKPAHPEEVARVRARHGLPQGYILFVGSIEARKNLQRLLRAYAELQQADERRTLVIAGARKGKYSDILTTVQELGLGNCVIFTGYVPEAELPALYSGADLFVFPSLYEGFGLPPLEAMACGTPVVCSNAASLPEVVGEAGLLVDPYDVQALAVAMHQVLTDKALSGELRAKGLKRAEQFNWERTAMETVAVYRQLVRES